MWYKITAESVRLENETGWVIEKRVSTKLSTKANPFNPCRVAIKITDPYQLLVEINISFIKWLYAVQL